MAGFKKLITSTLFLPAIYARCPGLNIPENGSSECNRDSLDRLTCVIRCDSGYLFADANGDITNQNVATFVCQNDNSWLPQPEYGDCLENNALANFNGKSTDFRYPSFAKVNPEADTCLLWNNRHIQTFDSAVYSFESIGCMYTLVEDCEDNSFNILLRNIDDHTSIMLIVFGDKNIMLQKTVNGNHLAQDIKNGKRDQVDGHYSGISFDSINDHFIVKIPDFFVLSWDTRMNKIAVEADLSLKNRLCGLCGNYNKAADDDFVDLMKQPVSNAPEFANAMRVKSVTCKGLPAPVSNACEDRTLCEDLLFNSHFQGCHDFVDANVYKATCEFDSCENQCNTLEAYIKVCKTFGVKIDSQWRAAANCPAPTCPGNRVWVECGATCENTCEQVGFIDVVNAECEKNNCLSGCRCPDNSFYDVLTDSCVTKDFCPCKHSNHFYQKGEIIQDDCNTCTCENGNFQCTDNECGATCKVLNNQYITTFDGLDYTLSSDLSNCDYTLLKKDENLVVNLHRNTWSDNNLEIYINNTVIQLDDEFGVLIDTKLVKVFPVNSDGYKISKTDF